LGSLASGLDRQKSNRWLIAGPREVKWEAGLLKQKAIDALIVAIEHF